MKVVEGKGEQNLFLGGLDSRLGLLSGGEPRVSAVLKRVSRWESVTRWKGTGSGRCKFRLLRLTR